MCWSWQGHYSLSLACLVITNLILKISFDVGRRFITRRFMDTDVYRTCTVKIWKTRRKFLYSVEV